MKFKERRGNVFVFDGGYDLEWELLEIGINVFTFKDVFIDQKLNIRTVGESVSYKDIQTAVNLMTILKNEGLV